MASQDVALVRTDGVLVADSLEDLFDGSIGAPINLGAGRETLGGDVWTGTLSTGEATMNCDDWSTEDSSVRGQCGSTQFTDGRWAENLVPTCGTRLRLFCFER
ncbi:MAG: hypothetical protein AAF654_04545 [Myxococcota bacterium]